MEPVTKKLKTSTERLRCNYMITKKNRQCGMTRRADSEYCSEHLNLLKKDIGNEKHNGRLDSENGRIRIPCPLDPNHSVWEDQLKKHLTKCNKFKLSHINDNNIFYSKDMNSCPHKTENIDYKLYLDKVIEILQSYQKTDTFEIPLKQEANEEMVQSRVNTLTNQKHAIQQSSLIQNMINHSILNISPSGNTQDYIEFGCGKAEFSRYLNQVILLSTESKDTRPITYHLIDRASNRMKFDTKIISDTQEITKQSKIKPHIDRIKIDIKDLKIDTQLNNDRTYVALSKHLCGVATDLTLRCIVNNSLLKQKLDGICIAMCCRHVCSANDYINPEHIKSILKEYDSDLTYVQFFTCLTKICSWATNGRRSDMNSTDIVEVTPTISMTIEERESLGLVARKIIDTGRLQWVKQNISEYSHLIRYVDKSISLENVALLVHST